MEKRTLKKEVVLLIIALVSGIYFAGAQGTSDQVTLRVNLVEMMNIQVNSEQETVNLTFETPEHFQNGVTTSKSQHLTLSSTMGYEVDVVVAGDLSNGTESIPASTVTVTPTYNSGTVPDDHTLTAQSLSTNEKLIISATSGAVETVYDVDYSASGGDDYIDIPAGTYTTTVTYTITSN